MKLFAFYGASGTGKSTIQHSLPLPFLTHYVTRELRDGEVDGFHVKQISIGQFKTYREIGLIATMTEYAGNFYGAPSLSIERIKAGVPHHATTTIDSILQFKGLLGDENVISVYIKPPDINTLIARMEARGDNMEDILKRVNHIYSTKELENEHYADYVIVNNILEDAIGEAHEIIKKELGTDDIERFLRNGEVIL